MSKVTLEGVSKNFGKVEAVKNFNLVIEDKEFLVLLGPSGCGKSSTMRMIAGLEDITAGEIAIDGRVINEFAPKDRDIAMVFQDYALYPHMRVSDNLAFPLRLRKTPADEIRRRVSRVAEGTEIDVVKIPPRAPNLNPICERFLGSVRRECLDHVVIVSERQLRRVLKAYCESYFNRARPHQGLWQGIPVAGSRSVPTAGGKVVPIPILGGLHHDYQRAA